MVSLSEVILDLGFSPYFKNTCLLAIYPSSVVGGYTILGDTFLRSAYVIYDLDNGQVAVTQANFGRQETRWWRAPKERFRLPREYRVAILNRQSNVPRQQPRCLQVHHKHLRLLLRLARQHPRSPRRRTVLV